VTQIFLFLSRNWQEKNLIFLRAYFVALPAELPGHIEPHNKNREEAEL